MRDYFNYFRFSFFILAIFASACKKEVIPVLTTASVTNITAVSVSCGGNITSDGNAHVASRGVCWSTHTNPSTSDSRTYDGEGIGLFSSTISGLSPATTYYVRAYATNSAGTAYGQELSFVTLGGAAQCITLAATAITSSGATLNGSVNPSYLSTTVSFEFGISTTYGNAVYPLQNPFTGGSNINVSFGISDLSPGTVYHYRIKAVNAIGTTTGEDMTFTTEATIPVLTTSEAVQLTQTSFTSGGMIISDGGLPVTERGICWDTRENPTISGMHKQEGSGTGSFTSQIKCLYHATTYYVRAYAVNGIGLAYGNQLIIKTEGSDPIIFNPSLNYGSLSDVDGNCYKTIQTGNQTWMAENLKTTKYRDGTEIPNITENIDWTVLDPPASYWWYDNDSLNYKNLYGALYNWYAVKTGNLCPDGWHVPSYKDWTSLRDYLGGIKNPLGFYNSGGKLKETGISHWKTPNSGADNSTGFTALPGGEWSPNANFFNLEMSGIWWSATSFDWLDAWRIDLSSDTDILRIEESSMKLGLSVRCIKD